MKRVRLIINPSSGRQSFENKIDNLSKMFLDNGYIVGKYFTAKKNDARDETIRTCKGDWDLIVACGGDGTVNEVANGIALSERKLPVAILSSGTVNDFANYMKIPNKSSEFFKMIERGKIIDIDLGKVNNQYFINVAAGGLLANVGYQVLPEAKAILGRLAYYLAGLKELIVEGIEPIEMTFESKEYSRTEKILLFLVTNTSSIGGFKNIAPDADISDHLLNVLIIRESDPIEIANTFINILTGEHVNLPNVEYFKTETISISSKEKIELDLDGEYGGNLPSNFEIIPRAMKIFV